MHSTSAFQLWIDISRLQMDKQTDPKYKTMPRYFILFSYPMDLADKSSANYTVTGIMILLNAQLCHISAFDEETQILWLTETCTMDVCLMIDAGNVNHYCTHIEVSIPFDSPFSVVYCQLRGLRLLSWHSASKI